MFESALRPMRRPDNSRLHPTARHGSGWEMMIWDEEPIAVSARRVNRKSH